MKRVVTIREYTPGGELVNEWIRETPIQLWHNPNPGQAFCQEKLDETGRRLLEAYREAAHDLMSKQASWIAAHEARVQKYQEQLRQGLITEADYRAWMRGQLFQQRAWELKRGQLARTMQEIDRRGLEMINEGRVEIFGENANYMRYRIDMVSGLTGAFGLYNVQSVLRLITEQPDLLPRLELDDEKSYRRYNEIITRSVLQGILQGETLDQIAWRVSIDAGERGLNTLRRDARTAYVSALNAGAVESMREAQDMGVKLEKQWLATLDTHTRDSHAHLDGQHVPVDEPFDSLLGEIYYPGDMGADPANVWNCRCTLVEYYPEYDTGHGLDRFDAAGNYVGDMTYDEWKEAMGDGDE